MSKRRSPSRNALRPQATSAWEWAIAIVGAVLVVGTVSYLIYFEASTTSRPPQVTIEQQLINRIGDKYLVRFTAQNQSSATAAGLRIRGELRQDGRIVESSELSFDYLPGFSERQGYFYFQQDPSIGELHVFPLSYVEPWRLKSAIQSPGSGSEAPCMAPVSRQIIGSALES